MRTVILSLLSSLALSTIGACAKTEAGCDALALKLCAANAEHCGDARGWIDTQGAGDAAARGEACTQMLADPQALAAYITRFAQATAVAPPAPAAPANAGPTGTPNTPSTPKPKATTQDQIRTFGDNVEEIGKTGEKAGEAIDKIGGAFDGKSDTRP